MTAYGSKYHATQHLDIAEVAKLVRADIKVGQAVGALPVTLAYGVRIQRYSMGKSINVTVTGLADRDHFTTDGYGRMVLTPAAQQLEDTLKAILAAYNYGNSRRFGAEVDIQTEDIAATEAG